ncbi:MAG: nitroreductase family protein [Balneolales bacterium]
MKKEETPLQPLKFEKITRQESQKRALAFYDLLKKRRTVRHFSKKKIPDTVIENSIKAAGTAPSGAHKQPWHFCVVKNPELKHKIRIAAENEEKQNYESRFSDSFKQDLAKFETSFVKEFIDDAPVIIVVFKETYQLRNGVQYRNYYVNESVGIASGILIAALHNAGLATLPHTPNPMKFLNGILERPGNESPILLMPVGYPVDNAKVPDIKRKPFWEIMHIYE